MKKHLSLSLLCASLLCTPHLKGETAQKKVAPIDPVAPRQASTPSPTTIEIEQLIRLAKAADKNGDLALSEQFYQRMLNLPASDQAKKEGLLAMAQTFEDHRSLPKAIAIYERYLTSFPNDTEASSILLKVGNLYREAGAYPMALDRYYNVLHSSLRVKSEKVNTYRALALRAQFEIAETYFQQGNYPEAIKYFKFVKALNLAKEDRDRASFKTLYSKFLSNNYAATIPLGETFIKDFPDSPNLPQVRYILAKSFKEAKRPEEALAQVLELLRSEKANAEKDPDAWLYWRKKAGNQLANEFYQQADFLSALTIYQSLAKLSDAPDWQWPVIFQMGLCFERLRATPRALEAFQYIIKAHEKIPQDQTISQNLKTLTESAQWHIEHLTWQQSAEVQLQSLLSAPELKVESAILQ